jgi:hypothetical protein
MRIPAHPGFDGDKAGASGSTTGQKLRAPRSQPVNTKSATKWGHRGGMASVRSNKGVLSDTRLAESIPEFKPWRELGWIFKDGHAVVIERQGSDVRIGKVVV